jgi:hypothetical protein
LLLHLCIPRDHRDVIERDLEEQYVDDIENPRLGPKFAKLYYWLRTLGNVGSFLRVGLLARLLDVIFRKWGF